MRRSNLLGTHPALGSVGISWVGARDSGKIPTPGKIFRKNPHPGGLSRRLFWSFYVLFVHKTAFDWLEMALKDYLSPIYHSLYSKVGKNRAKRYGKIPTPWDMENAWEKSPPPGKNVGKNPLFCPGGVGTWKIWRPHYLRVFSYKKSKNYDRVYAHALAPKSRLFTPFDPGGQNRSSRYPIDLKFFVFLVPNNLLVPNFSFVSAPVAFLWRILIGWFSQLSLF